MIKSSSRHCERSVAILSSEQEIATSLLLLAMTEERITKLVLSKRKRERIESRFFYDDLDGMLAVFIVLDQFI